MSPVTIIFCAIVLFFCWRGYHKGFIKSISRLLSWIVAYPCAIFFTKPLGKILIQYTPLDGLLVYFVAGSVIFLVVSLLVVLLLNAIAQLVPESDATATSSKVGGASVGLLMGTLTGLLVAYIAVVVKKPDSASDALSVNDAAQVSISAQNPATQDRAAATGVPRMQDLRSARESFIETSAKKLMSTAAATAVDIALDDKAATQVTKAFVEDPQTMLTHVQQAANSGKMKMLLSDEKVQSLLTTGDVYALTHNADFQAVMSDPDIAALLATANDPDSGSTGEQAAAEKMVAAWQRVDTIKHDPRIIAIIQDPEFQAQLNAPNKLQLMMNPKLNQLTEIIFSKETPAATGMGNYEIQNLDQNNGVTYDNPTNTPTNKLTNNQNVNQDSNKAPTTIYRWTDENGKVHYSDKPKQ